MKENYKFMLGFNDAECEFEVDKEKFTSQMAQETLDFFSWDIPYDKDADPIDEVMKKYAAAVIYSATHDHLSTYGVIELFKTCEGYCSLDGEYGIKLIHVSGYEINDDDIERIYPEPGNCENCGGDGYLDFDDDGNEIPESKCKACNGTGLKSQ